MKLKDLLSEDPDYADSGPEEFEYDDHDARPFVLAGSMLIIGMTNGITHGDIAVNVSRAFKKSKLYSGDKKNQAFKIVLNKNGADIFGNIDLDIASEMNESYKKYGIEAGRLMGDVHGRIWKDRGVISFWDDNDDIKKHYSRVEKAFKSAGIDLSEYYVDEWQYLYQMIPWNEFGGSEDVDPVEKKVKSEIVDLVKQLSHGASKSEKMKIAGKIKNIIDSTRKSSLDIDFGKIEDFVKDALNRWTGSEEAMKRAKKAGYDTVTQQKSAMPFLEENKINLKDLI